MRYAAEAFGQRDVLGFCDVSNKASRAVMERAGFVFWGLRNLTREFGPGATQSCVYALPHMEKDWVRWGVVVEEEEGEGAREKKEEVGGGGDGK
jgi:RimJ/RimL family protein N-acetyltransferase